MKKFLIFVLTLAITASFAIFTAQTPASAYNDEVKLKVFVHDPAPPGKPAISSNCSVTINDQVADYGLTGWQMPAGGMVYKINYSTKPSNLADAQVTDSLAAAFGAWTAADTGQIFTAGGTTSVRTAKLDGTNAILWKGIKSGALAITYAWYYTSTGQLAEADTVFNRNYQWTLTAYNGTNDCGGTIGAYDVQNIATHEFGHWIGLDDLYDSQDKDLTMYGYGQPTELKKNTLGNGDILGVNAVLP